MNNFTSGAFLMALNIFLFHIIKLECIDNNSTKFGQGIMILSIFTICFVLGTSVRSDQSVSPERSS